MSEVGKTLNLVIFSTFTVADHHSSNFDPNHSPLEGDDKGSLSSERGEDSNAPSFGPVYRLWFHFWDVKVRGGGEKGVCKGAKLTNPPPIDLTGS